MLGFKSFEAAHDTLVEIELMHMMKKRQLMVEAGAEGLSAAEQFYALAVSSLHRPGPLPLHDLLGKICDKALHRTRDGRTRRRRAVGYAGERYETAWSSNGPSLAVHDGGAQSNTT
jgi:hypothetical protein